MRSLTAPRPCRFEVEVLELARTHRWPDRADADLRDHATRCDACAEVALVATALGAEWEAAAREPAPPNAHVVWWRAQRRARVEAARVAARPASWAHLAAIAAALVALAWSAWSSVGRLGAWLSRADSADWVVWLLSAAEGGPSAPSVIALGVLAGAVFVALVLAPVALWLALSDP